MYYVSNGSLRPANRQYNTTNNDYEMALNERSVIVRRAAPGRNRPLQDSAPWLLPRAARAAGRTRLTAEAPSFLLQEEAEDVTEMAVEVTFQFMVRPLTPQRIGKTAQNDPPQPEPRAPLR